MTFILWIITALAFYYLWKVKKMPGFLLVVGFALILWADAVCDFFKMATTPGTVRIFVITSILLFLVLRSKKGKKLLKLIKGQLGG